MSSFFGLVDFEGRGFTREAFDQMTEKMNCWEADARGSWRNEQVAFGSMLLHVTPESKNEPLPYYDKLHQMVITADAIIYNRDELFQRLRVPLVERQLIPDSQLILESYIQWGRECLEYFVGDFAFAIWDLKREELFCARDHVGVRPFFYHFREGFFAFATQMRGVLVLPGIQENWNQEFIDELLFAGLPFDNIKTFYKDIRRLSPAHYILVTNGSLEIKSYWDLERLPPEKLPNEKTYIEKARYLLQEAVRCRMRTDYPVGAQLSGGLDSSGITMLAAQNARKNDIIFSTYSNKLKDELQGKHFPYVDEREYIFEILKAGEISNYSFTDYGERAMRFYIEGQIELLDGLADIDSAIMTSLCSEKAVANGVRNMLSGFFGDEMITMDSHLVYFYELFRKKRWNSLWFFLMKRYNRQYLKSIKIFLRTGLRFNPVGRRILYTYYKMRGLGEQNYNPYADCVLNPTWQKEKIAKLRESSPYHNHKYQSIKEAEFFYLHQMSYLTYRLEAENIVGLQNRINLVYPWSDVRLLHFFHHAPFELKNRNGLGRYLYREAMKGILPDLVRLREKDCYMVMPDAFHQMNRDQKMISDQLGHFRDCGILGEYIDYDKLMKWWESRLEGKYVFATTGCYALALMSLKRKEIF